MTYGDEAWVTREAALNEALAKAQGEFPAIPRDKRVTVKTKSGDRYSYNYAPLEAILKAVRPVLAKHGLALTQPLDGEELRTELRHAGGGLIISRYQAPRPSEGWQAFGSGMTYLRRYAISAILGIATEEDDDGAEADKPKPRGGKPGPRAAKPADDPDPGPATPPPTDNPELAGLVTEVRHKLEHLAKLEAQLERPETDWLAWVRERVGLRGEELGGPEHYRQAAEELGREEARLIGELAERTAKEV